MQTGPVVPTLIGPLGLCGVPRQEPRFLILEASERRFPFEC
jgi:hypothetical protein